jgi:tetratricopeptide (TPR) repeat protein
MGLFTSLFGKSDPVAELTKLHARGEWAALLAAAKRLERATLTPEVQAQVAGWEADAGDRLAGLNIEEGEGALRLGNLLKAREHLQLAAAQARSAALLKRAEQLLAGLEGGVPPVGGKDQAAAAGCGSGCGPTCAPAKEGADEFDEIDAAGRLELLLSTLPVDLAARYAAAGDAFLKAWLAAQEGDDRLALQLFEAVPTAERGTLFRAERGVVLARNGQNKAAEADLRGALTAFPELFHPFDALVTLLAVSRRWADLEQLLRQALAEERFTGYCWSRIAQLEAGRGNAAAAVTACDLALSQGELDPSTVVVCAELHERAADSAAAEALLARLPAGGCGGGAHPLLAEFWLRHGKNLTRALESFKGALRSEPDNPRWLLRIAQVYIAKGWQKDAVGPIESLLARGGLPAELAAEVQAAAEALKAR